MFKKALIEIIRDLNESVTSNPEYLRGQVELAVSLLGYSDDGYAEQLSLLTEAFPGSSLSDRKAVL